MRQPQQYRSSGVSMQQQTDAHVQREAGGCGSTCSRAGSTAPSMPRHSAHACCACCDTMLCTSGSQQRSRAAMSRDSSCGPSTAAVLLPLAMVVPPRPAGRSTAAGRRVARSPAVVPLPGPSRPSAHSLLVDSRVCSSRRAVARTVMDSSPRESISSSICSCCASLPRSLASVCARAAMGRAGQGLVPAGTCVERPACD